MIDNYYAVIMAGGGGTRLWPLSRKASPKQMLPLVGERSLFQIAVDRLDGVFTPDQIYVVTVADQADVLQEQCPEIPAENYLLEPMPRGTASVVGLAAVALQQRDPQAVMAVLTADHIFQNEAHFRKLLLSAYDAAQQDHLVTLGIAPTFPSTGYGYIQQGDWVEAHHDLDVYQVLRFVEKPDESRARAMLESGDHAWNSGMFVWQVGRIMEEFKRQMPDLSSKLNEISRVWDQPQRESVIQRVWPQIQPETIDYGIMENARDVVVIPGEGLGWNDVGSWEALFEVLPADEQGNIILGDEFIPIETRDTLVYKKSSPRLIVTIGVEDLVVVDTGDVLLVCKKDQAQKVRQVVKQLKDAGGDYL
ncbi:MAG: mannose-1-phosphate guanylyltransferase [Anaerolineales bacterium]|nr:mannose-1-phosphate guanylyltransferase [Anaerolineales bacterium]